MRLLLSCLFSAASITAQSDLRLGVLPDATEARVAGVAMGAPIGLVLGVEAGHVPLPGGSALSLQPIVVAAMGLADRFGTGLLEVSYPMGQASGLTFLAQAIALDPALPFGQPGSVLVTPRRTGEVPRIGDEVDFVVLFGQSNAEGFARASALPNALQGAHPEVRIWSAAMSEWQPLEAGKNSHLLLDAPYFGPEVGFAASIDAFDRPLWVVKVATSSSSLGPTPGPFNEWGPAAGELYAVLLQQVGAAATAARALGLRPRVRLICMMQGETDSLSPVLAAEYEANLSTLLEVMRFDLGALDLQGDVAPMIRIGLVSPYLRRLGFPDAAVVRAAQRAVAANLPRCEVVETADLGLMPDRVHLAADGLLELGRRFVMRGW